jgi:hypothetical protein
MDVTVERVKKYRRLFGWGFVGSSLLLALLVSAMPMSRPSDTKLSPEILLALGSFVTSFTTLIGFVVTTGIMWRKERRESLHASIELEKSKIELEKLRREISDKNAAAQEKKKKTSKRRRVV